VVFRIVLYDCVKTHRHFCRWTRCPMYVLRRRLTRAAAWFRLSAMNREEFAVSQTWWLTAWCVPIVLSYRGFLQLGRVGFPIYESDRMLADILVYVAVTTPANSDERKAARSLFAQAAHTLGVTVCKPLTDLQLNDFEALVVQVHEQYPLIPETHVKAKDAIKVL